MAGGQVGNFGAFALAVKFPAVVAAGEVLAKDKALVQGDALVGAGVFEGVDVALGVPINGDRLLPDGDGDDLPWLEAIGPGDGVPVVGIDAGVSDRVADLLAL